jgi:hypothetical protein
MSSNWPDNAKESTSYQSEEEGQENPGEQSQGLSWQTPFEDADYQLATQSFGQFSDTTGVDPTVTQEHDASERIESERPPPGNPEPTFSCVDTFQNISHGHLGPHHHSAEDSMFDDDNPLLSESTFLEPLTERDGREHDAVGVSRMVNRFDHRPVYSHSHAPFQENDDDLDRKLSPNTRPEAPCCALTDESTYLKPPPVASLNHLNNPEAVSHSMVYYFNQYHYLYTHNLFQEYDEDLDRKLPPAAKPEWPRFRFPLEASTDLKPPPVASKNPEKKPPRKAAKNVKRKRKRRQHTSPTNPGERTKERKEPTQEEWDEERTPRGRYALRNWYDRLNELYQYKLEHGDSEYREQNVGNYELLLLFSNFLLANVRQKYMENPELGNWVNKQRMELKAHEEPGKKSSITELKIQRLEEVGFVG